MKKLPDYVEVAINDFYRAARANGSDSSAYASMRVREARGELSEAIFRYCGENIEPASSESEGR